jgi:hypothetical protein
VAVEEIVSLGTWPLTTPAERDAVAFLISHLPADGRYEIEIRNAPEQTMSLTIEAVCASMAIPGGAHPSLTEAIRIRPPGHVLEFGVFCGDSLRHIAGQVADTVHGFDSFQGLPEDWTWHIDGPNDHPKGYLATSARNVHWPANARIWPGWFADTVPQWLAEVPGNIGLIHIDSDLYSSARTILFGLNERIVPGTVLVFDELYLGWDDVKAKYANWQAHEWRALQEWLAECDRAVRPHSHSMRYAATVVVTR